MTQDFFDDLDAKFRSFFKLPPKNAPSSNTAAINEVAPEEELPPDAETTEEGKSVMPNLQESLTGFSSQVQDTLTQWQEEAKRRNEEFQAKTMANQEKFKAQIQTNNENIKNFFTGLGKKWDEQVQKWQDDMKQRRDEIDTDLEARKQKMRNDWVEFVQQSRDDYNKSVSFGFKVGMKIWVQVLLIIIAIVVVIVVVVEIINKVMKF